MPRDSLPRQRVGCQTLVLQILFDAIAPAGTFRGRCASRAVARVLLSSSCMWAKHSLGFLLIGSVLPIALGCGVERAADSAEVGQLPARQDIPQSLEGLMRRMIAQAGFDRVWEEAYDAADHMAGEELKQQTNALLLEVAHADAGAHEQLARGLGALGWLEPKLIEQLGRALVRPTAGVEADEPVQLEGSRLALEALALEAELLAVSIMAEMLPARVERRELHQAQRAALEARQAQAEEAGETRPAEYAPDLLQTFDALAAAKETVNVQEVYTALSNRIAQLKKRLPNGNLSEQSPNCQAQRDDMGSGMWVQSAGPAAVHVNEGEFQKQLGLETPMVLTELNHAPAALAEATRLVQERAEEAPAQCHASVILWRKRASAFGENPDHIYSSVRSAACGQAADPELRTPFMLESIQIPSVDTSTGSAEAGAEKLGVQEVPVLMQLHQDDVGCYVAQSQALLDALVSWYDHPLHWREDARTRPIQWVTVTRNPCGN